VRIGILSADMALIRALSEAARERRLSVSVWSPSTLAAATFAPHVVAFDVATVPVEELARCRCRFGQTRWLVLGPVEPQLVVQSFAAGADSWMLRSETPEDIALVLEMLARGIVGLSHSVLEFLLSLASIDGDHGPLSQASGLSPRQFEVLSMAARGLTDREIADRLVLSVRTVNRHMSDILTVLHCSGRKEASRLLFGESGQHDAAPPGPPELARRLA
jgi:DNA-binding NarL/FixJ family response regulator